MSEYKELIESYLEYVRKLPGGAMEISENLRMGKYTEAFNQIIQIAEGIDWLTRVENILLNNNIPWDGSVVKANMFLEIINDALEKSDYVYVADIFEYELSPFFQEHLSLIEKK